MNSKEFIGDMGVVTWLSSRDDDSAIHRYELQGIHRWHESFICLTCLTYMFSTTLAYFWHDSFMLLTWLLHMSDLTHSYVWRASCIRAMTGEFQQISYRMCWNAYETWLVHKAFISDSFISLTWRIHLSCMQIYRVAMTHRIPYLYRSFVAKGIYI